MLTLLQDAAHGAAPAAVEGAHAAGFHPVGPWLIIALPLLGFALNGLLSVIAARRALPKLPPVGDPSYDAHHADASEQEHHASHEDHAHDAHAHDAHAHDTHDSHDAPAP